jgi:hypothetical protein
MFTGAVPACEPFVRLLVGSGRGCSVDVLVDFNALDSLDALHDARSSSATNSAAHPVERLTVHATLRAGRFEPVGSSRRP